jgi:hypothetical protein
MKNLLFASLLCCAGCTTFLRYDYEAALRNLPQNTRVIDITNDYIWYETYTTNTPKGTIVIVEGKRYDTTNNVTFTPYQDVTINRYKAKYGADGKILKTTKIQ